MSNFIDEINTIFDENILVSNKTKELSTIIDECAKKIIAALKNNGKVILFGNGGSAADAQHMAAELVGRFKIERSSIAAISLTTDTSIITSIGNDYDFENIFSRQIESLGNKHDIIIAISTSGNSKNVINGVKSAKNKGIFVIALSGKSDSELKDLADITINAPSDDTARIQESHRIIIHCLCQLVEKSIVSS
jgi:D-sedoheptulose 7-phosphate isomerase